MPTLAACPLYCGENKFYKLISSQLKKNLLNGNHRVIVKKKKNKYRWKMTAMTQPYQDMTEKILWLYQNN